MTSPNDPFDDAVRRIGLKKENELEHPDVEKLADYLDGLLTPEERDEVQEQLTWSRSGMATLRQLKEPLSFEPDPNLKHVNLPSPKNQSDPGEVRPIPKPVKQISLLPLAAALVIGVGLGFLWTRQNKPMPSDPAPQAHGNVAFLELDITKPVNIRGQNSAPADTGLALRIFVDMAEANYTLEITGPDNQIHWRSSNLKPDTRGFLHINLDPGFLSRGEHELNLKAIDGVEERNVFETRLLIE